MDRGGRDRATPELADLVERLRGAVSPLGRPQLVHGDLTGNVLLRTGAPPVVLDLSPSWRHRPAMVALGL